MIAHQILSKSTSPLTTVCEANAQARYGFISGVGDIKLSETWVFSDASCLHMTFVRGLPVFQVFNSNIFYTDINDFIDDGCECHEED